MPGQLKVPGLRARMGDWVYYITFLKMRDIAERVFLATEIHRSQVLRELIQRQVDESSHSTSITQYLLHQRQRFFNALVIGVYGGSPAWLELSVEQSKQLGLDKLPRYIEGALGILVFDGSEKLFAIDGQHRVVGIKNALAQKPDLGEEEQSVIFLAHERSTKGMQRTRRLFTTLNRYAKPVSKMEIIALDEDDVLAIVTRRLLEHYPLFRNWTAITKGKNIPIGDRKKLTTIVALYDALDSYFATEPRAWKEFRKLRPSDTGIDSYYERAKELWDAMLDRFPPLQRLVDSKPDDEVAAEYRNENGGHLLFRPVGLVLVVAVIRAFMDEGHKLKRIVRALSEAPMTLAEVPWSGLLWDPANRRMTISGERQRVALRVLFCGLGGDLKRFKTTPGDLRAELAGLLVKDISDVRLPRFAHVAT